MDDKLRIIQAYKDLALEGGRLPVSIQKVCDKAEASRKSFHDLFESLEEVQRQVWQEYFFTTIHTIEGAGEYNEYMVREKLLAFYYTLLEVLRPEMEFVRFFEKQFSIWEYNPSCLAHFKPHFLAFVTELVEEGRSSGEVAERYVIGGDYAGWHWPQVLYILGFWLRDKSEEATSTDQAVEKAVNFGFDVMGRNVLDSAFELARFVFTKRGS